MHRRICHDMPSSNQDHEASRLTRFEMMLGTYINLGEKMISKKAAVATAALALSAMGTTANAYEFGFPGWEQRPGLTLGATTAASPPPGVYMTDSVNTLQATLGGPGAPMIGGVPTQLHTAGASVGFVIVPGWEFLGATYNAVIVQPYLMTDVGSPVNLALSGLHNTYIVPAELSWKLGTSGFVLKAGVGVYVPDGQILGPTGLAGQGNPWWTFQPELIVSYFNSGWALTASTFEEINTASSKTGYTSGDILHFEASAIKTIDKWSVGPVAYYIGQVTSDKGSTTGFYGGLTNINGYDMWGVGGRVSYNFGAATLNVWATDDVSQSVTRGTSFAPGGGAVAHGFSAFASLSYRIWAPDEAQSNPKISMLHK